jgi:deoxyribodipyrimidine photo-lyase
MSRPAIVWFRGCDLRLEDNPAFTLAVASGAPVWPIFIADPAQKRGAASAWWLHWALEDLEAQLREQGLRLTLLRGPVLRTLHAVCPAGAPLYYNRVHTPEGAALEAKLPRSSVGSESELLFPALLERPALVFRPFYERAMALSVAPPLGLPKGRAKLYASGHVGQVSLPDLQLLPKIRWDRGLEETWGRPGLWVAKARLKAFQSQEGAYAKLRELPAAEGTSRLSPYLAFGQLSARQVASAVPHEGAFYRQLIWREFTRNVLRHHPDLSRAPIATKFQKFPWEPNEAYRQAWQRGLTGYPLVDAGMRQLWATGWMPNRVRMVVASFWVKHLLQDWREGLAWFADTLVDADEANNTFGWQWAAGCGADAAPFFRIFNPTLQQQKFDPRLTYIKRWVPEFGSASYPAPIVDHAQARAKALQAFRSLKP